MIQNRPKIMFLFLEDFLTGWAQNYFLTRWPQNY